MARRSVAATEGGDGRRASSGSISPCAGARTPVERTESSRIRTTGRKMTVALKGCVERMVGFQPPGASMALDHPARTAIVDHDASRSSAAHDIGGPARHGLHGPYRWFGSAGLPRVAFLPGLLGHSLRCSKFGRDRNSDRSTPVHGTEHTKTTGHALRRRVLARDEVNRACKNAAPTSLPTPLRSATSRSSQRSRQYARPRGDAMGTCRTPNLIGSVRRRRRGIHLTASARSLRRYGGRARSRLLRRVR
jgi:hypothetical protein